MTFEQRCKRFEKKSEKETNIFKYIYRVIFIERKKAENAKELENTFFEDWKKEERERRRKNKI